MTFRGMTMRNTLYNFFIRDVTLMCYHTCLTYVRPGSRILDVGIGNGAMIGEFHGIIREKNLSITGLDINRHYLEHCRMQIRKNGLEDRVTVIFMPVENYDPPQDRLFDYILFSMSFMLLKDPGRVLDRVRKWLKPGGNILFFHTIFKKPSPIIDILKPRLKYVTTVDFGRPIYEDEFYLLLSRKGLTVEDDRTVARKWFGGEYRFLVAWPFAKSGEKDRLQPETQTVPVRKSAVMLGSPQGQGIPPLSPGDLIRNTGRMKKTVSKRDKGIDFS